MDLDIGLDISLDLDFLGEKPCEYEVIETHERFDLFAACERLKGIKLPADSETVRVISPANGFSSAALICEISRQNGGIAEMHATTLRVGKKESQLLADLAIPNCEIVACGIMRHNGEYNYSGQVEQTFAKAGYKLGYAKNHSKVILIITNNGKKIVIETSSNLNENPKIEQFTITQSEAVHDWYLQQLRGLGVFR